VGAYAITQGTLAASANYNLTYTGADLTVTSRPITVSADDIAKLFGDPDPDLTFRISGAGLVNSDQLSGGLLRDPGELVGIYLIRQGTLANPNYTITFAPGTFTINPSQPVDQPIQVPSELSSGVLHGIVYFTNPVSGDVDFTTPLVPTDPNALIQSCELVSDGVCIDTRN
jgi:hypothetical protein